MNNKEQTKRNNRMALLRQIRWGGATRAELAREVGLSRAAVTLLTDELLQEGIIWERERQPSEGGRGGIRLGIRPSAYSILGLDFCRDGVHLVVTDFRLQMLSHRFFPAALGRERTLDAIDAAVRDLNSETPWLGAGIAAPGPVDLRMRRILTPSGMEAWHGFSIDELEARLSLPVTLQKDTDALAIAEKNTVYPHGSSLILLADHGLGGALIHQGRLFEGGGELGHITLDPHGERCSCGRRGCAEGYASIPATLRAARERGLAVGWPTLCAHATDGDAVALEVLERQIDALTSVVLNAVNLLEPDRILLEGELSMAWSIIAPRMQKRLQREAFTPHGRRIRVLPSGLPTHARAYAAASLVLENYFSGEEL